MISPRLGLSIPAIKLRSVDLPLPDFPIKETNPKLGSFKLKFS